MSAAHTQGRMHVTQPSKQMLITEGRVACIAETYNQDAVANARRLAACWNACKGVDTDLLEQHPEPFSELRAHRDFLLGLHRKHMELIVDIAQELKSPRLPLGQTVEASVRMLALAAKEALDAIEKTTGVKP